MIRALKSTDIPLIQDIYYRSNIESGLNIPDEYFQRDKIKYTNETLHKCENLIYEVSGQAIGIISISHNYIEGLFVDPLFWKKGIGTALLKSAIAKTGELRLQVYQDNSRAVELYRKNGFLIIGGGICQMTGLSYFEMVYEKREIS